MLSKLIQILSCLFVFSLLALSCWGTTIGISNPSPKNLERILYLSKHSIIEIKDLEIIGVLHENQKELYQQSLDYVSNNNYSNISFIFIKDFAPLEQFNETNIWTDQFKKILSETDGFIFNGGADIPPVLYEEETLLGTGILEQERLWELSFIFHLLGSPRNKSFSPFLTSNKSYVVFGICLGMQEMNVAAGGSMYQDIPLEIFNLRTYEQYHQLRPELRHRNDLSKMSYLELDTMGLHFHPLMISKGSFLDISNELLGSEVLVPSVHHQALKQIAPDFEVIATSIDGKVVEAIQHCSYPNVYGIQFHPELSELYSQSSLKIGNDEYFELNEPSVVFYKAIWRDFSRRF